MENGQCNEKAEFVLQYKVQGVTYNDPFCREHAVSHGLYLRNHLKLKVKVFKFGEEKEVVQFT